MNKRHDNPTKYDNGDIYGSISMCKNMFNALYSMQMPWLSTLSNCRQYCGVLESQSAVALKYYDCTQYSFSRKDKDEHGRVQASKKHMYMSSQEPLYTY